PNLVHPRWSKSTAVPYCLIEILQNRAHSLPFSCNANHSSDTSVQPFQQPLHGNLARPGKNVPPRHTRPYYRRASACFFSQRGNYKSRSVPLLCHDSPNNDHRAFYRLSNEQERTVKHAH
ncbi:Uncharacterized protein DAT39_004561, partial [Clarias magur]